MFSWIGVKPSGPAPSKAQVKDILARGASRDVLAAARKEAEQSGDKAKAEVITKEMQRLDVPGAHPGISQHAAAVIGHAQIQAAIQHAAIEKHQNQTGERVTDDSHPRDEHGRFTNK